jgi:hypothetical protein
MRGVYSSFPCQSFLTQETFWGRKYHITDKEFSFYKGYKDETWQKNIKYTLICSVQEVKLFTWSRIQLKQAPPSKSLSSAFKKFTY